jgi:hypothetical protein
MKVYCGRQIFMLRILSSGVLHRVALVRTDVSEKLNASIISFSETSVLTRATRRNIPEDGILTAVKASNLT